MSGRITSAGHHLNKLGRVYSYKKSLLPDHLFWDSETEKIADANHPLCSMFQALSSKASDLINAQAGLLTRFRYKHLPGNYPSGYWHFAYAFSETYSSGTVQDSHLIPF